MRPRRVVIRLLICLALGALTAILVAWGSTAASLPFANRRSFWTTRTATLGVEYYSCAVRGARRCVLAGPTLTRSGIFKTPVDAQEASDWTLELLDNLRFARAFPESWAEQPDQRLPPGWTWVGSIQDARGWPAVALWCEWPIAITPPGGTPPGDYGAIQRVRGGIELPRAARGLPADAIRALPLRPVWSGLAIDSAFFALPWLVLFPAGAFTGRAIRGQWRRSHNRCPACAYSLAGLPEGATCPECGALAP